MAVFRNSPLIGGIAGKVWVVTFVTSGRGQVIRGCASTVGRSSQGLCQSRARWASVKNRWAVLSDANRQSWRDRAALVKEPNALGVNRALSGYELFSRVAMVQLVKGGTAPAAAPVKVVNSMLRVVSLTMDAGGNLGFELWWPEKPTRMYYFFWVACQRGYAGRALLRRWKWVGYTSTLTGTGSWSLSNSARLGFIPPAGARLGVKVMNVTDYAVGAPTIVECPWTIGTVTF